MKTLVLLMMLVVAACVSHRESTSAVRAVVRSYGEVVALSTPHAERTFVAELEITAPSDLQGRLVSVSSNEPLPATHLFRKAGARLRLSIDSLESGRGTSLVPAEGVTRIVYRTKFESVRSVAEEADQPSAAVFSKHD